MRSALAIRVAVSLLVAGILLGAAPSAPVPSSPGPSTPAVATSPAPLPAAVAATMRLTFRLPPLSGAEYTPNARNVAMRSAASGPLLLFLPATGAVPRDYRQFLHTAASLGYHVLGLDYWNIGLSVAHTCGSDARCYGEVQANRFDGSRSGRFSAVAPGDSILARLRQALAVLRTHDPHGGWNRYLHGENVDWSRIVLAGHSQGGGESAYIAHRYRVQGVLMFASPVGADGTVMPSWMTRKGATAISRYYGFGDTHDVYYPRIAAAWAALGVGGRSQPVSAVAGLPFGGGHRILSDVVFGTPGAAHRGVVADDGPRSHSGSALFEPVWRWMLRAVRTSPPPS